MILGAQTAAVVIGIAATMLTATMFLIQRGEPFINLPAIAGRNSAVYLIAGMCLALGVGRWSINARLFGLGPNHGRHE